ncbi:MAG: hypothetical protein IJL51_00445 [Oscillospiraceae bacterium]|nr:hypothetical protein [Oscillospiraceae bacterium]
MKKAWNVVLVIVFVIILLGATAIGVGYLTGADLEQVYMTLEKSPVATFILRLISYWEKGFAYAQQLVADLPQFFAGLF